MCLCTCCITLHPTNINFTYYFSGACGTFIKINLPLSHETSVDKCQVILSQTHNPYPIIRKTLGKLKVRDILQNV